MADEARLSFKHVDEFWQFVQAGAPEESAEARQPLGIGEQVAVSIPSVRHRPKLVHEKRRAVQARTLLTKEDWPSEGKTNQDRQN